MGLFGKRSEQGQIVIHLAQLQGSDLIPEEPTFDIFQCSTLHASSFSLGVAVLILCNGLDKACR